MERVMAKSKVKSWRDVLPVHEAADLFPSLSEKELKALADDIYKNGLKVPITLWAATPDRKEQRYLLDGRGRLDAMELAGMATLDRYGALSEYMGLKWIEVYGQENVLSMTVGGNPSDLKERTKPSTDPWDYVISVNIRRRHLAPNQTAVLLENIEKRHPGLTHAEMAKRLNVSKTTVHKHRRRAHVHPGRCGPTHRDQRILSEAKIIALKAAIAENPKASGEAIARKTGISRNAVLRHRRGQIKQKSPLLIESARALRSIKNLWSKLIPEDKKAFRKFIGS
jgi:hypothetical protein